MIDIEPLKTKAALMTSLTGLSVAGFVALLAAFAPAYEEALKGRDEEWATPRQRGRDAGPKGARPDMADNWGLSCSTVGYIQGRWRKASSWGGDTPTPMNGSISEGRFSKRRS